MIGFRIFLNSLKLSKTKCVHIHITPGRGPTSFIRFRGSLRPSQKVWNHWPISAINTKRTYLQPEKKHAKCTFTWQLCGCMYRWAYNFQEQKQRCLREFTEQSTFPGPLNSGSFCSHWAPAVAAWIHLFLGSNIHHSGQRTGVCNSLLSPVWDADIPLCGSCF